MFSLWYNVALFRSLNAVLRYYGSVIALVEQQQSGCLVLFGAVWVLAGKKTKGKKTAFATQLKVETYINFVPAV